MATQVASAAVSAASAASTAVKVTPQGGVLEGVNPTQYTASNPIILFIIQAGIIIIFCRLLHWPLSKLRQPRVIAEVIGGIILGPSVMMRIPGFKATIFPPDGMPILNIVANLGLLLFLFLVALEVDMRMFMSNWRAALSVSFAGMLLPFGLGVGIAYGLYNEFRNDPGIVPINFGTYALFIGTALSITAFPVLCRILTELNLLGTPVGVTVLAAGVGNDVVGWILLALCVALVNNASGLTALWVLLCCVGWVLFLVFGIRPCFHYVLRRSGSIQNGPTQSMVGLTLLLMLTSAWFTGIIGVHPIFGAFLAGLICPHDGGFAIKLTEKIEDLVTVLFLPLYFALSGLSTDLGLLNDGITWAYVIGVIAIAFAAKIIGGTLAARANKLVWRESLTIGVLMSCKGLVELIVLNIGLQARILSTRTFTMFVVMALVTTVATTPLTTLLYPPWYQKKLMAWKRGEIDWDGNQLSPGQDSGSDSMEKIRSIKARRLIVSLRLESLPSLFAFIALLVGDVPAPPKKTHRSKIESGSATQSDNTPSLDTPAKRPLEVHGLHLLELTERTSSVMKVAEIEEENYRDPVVSTFRSFAQLSNIAVSGSTSVIPGISFAENLISHATDLSSDLLIIPWSETGSLTEGDQSTLVTENLWQDRFSGGAHSSFIQETLNNAVCNTAVFINHGFGGAPVIPDRPLRRIVSGLSIGGHHERPVAPIADRSHHVFFPFFGGIDDRVALRFVLQLAENGSITATILHIKSDISEATSDSKAPEVISSLTQPSSSRSDRIGISDLTTTDKEAIAASAAQDTNFLEVLRDSLPAELAQRVVFTEVVSNNPVATCLKTARQEVAQTSLNAGDLIVLGRSQASQHLAVSGSVPEIQRSLGYVAEAVISSSIKASILVVQAAGKGLDS